MTWEQKKRKQILVSWGYLIKKLAINRRGCSKSPVNLTLRITLLACFSAALVSKCIHSASWKRKPLFLRAKQVRWRFSWCLKLRRLELLGLFYPPFEHILYDAFVHLRCA